MGFFNSIKNAFLDEETETVKEETAGIPDAGAKWLSDYCQSAVKIWQLQYALAVVTKILSTFLINVEWKTFRKSDVVKGDEWYRLNYAPNSKETSAEFYTKLANKFVYEGKALIIETAQKELFIADQFEFKNGKELLMKENTFINVKIGDITLNRSFKENETCMYVKAPRHEEIEQIMESMASDFQNLRELIYEGANKALGMKLALGLNAQAKNKYDDKYLAKLQKAYEPLMKAPNAVFVYYKGEQLSDLTEKQRGSEVQQVLEAVENNIKVNEEILTNVGGMFGIPEKFMKGDFTADNDSIFAMCMTMFAKPYLTLLSQKYSTFFLTKEDIIGGSKIIANLDSVKFVESLAMATSIDKLIGSGAYTINEVREKIGDDPVDDGDVRFITKNYAVLSEYVKGNGDTT